jgi:hypothetical protein
LWTKKILDWTEGKRAYLSVVFTWQLPEAYARCVWYREQGYEVIAGGPAVALMPHVLSTVSTNHLEIPCLQKHNPDATRFSTGCVNRCKFCAIWRTEGDLKERRGGPKPIVCDNNSLALSRKHFDYMIDTLMPVPEVDFNQGLDCRLLNDHHVERLKDLDIKYIRFSWDYLDEETQVMDAIKRVREAGYPKDKIRIYVLFNHEDTPEDATYRLKTLYKMHIVANPMRYQPLDTLVRDSYVSPNWDRRELKRFTRYWNRSNWLGGIEYSKFKG